MANFLQQAVTLNGTTQYANRAIVSTVNNNFSIVLWVNYTSFGASESAVFNNGATDGNGYSLRVSTGGVFSTDLAFIANVNSAYTLSTGTWYQLAFIRDAGTSQCYVNATAQGSSSASSPNTPSDWVTIGASQVAAGTVSKFANAKIQDVRFYERAITTTELTQLYNYATNSRDYADISSTSLKSYWKLDGNYLDSSVTNSAVSPTASPTFVAGNVEDYRATVGNYNIPRYIGVSNGMSRSEGAN